MAGYKFAKSKASLISGIVFGTMSGIAAVMLIQGNQFGPGLAALSATMVLIFFGLKCTRALREKKPFGRAGVIFLVSLGELAALYLTR